jgi:hypothetical protein
MARNAIKNYASRDLPLLNYQYIGVRHNCERKEVCKRKCLMVRAKANTGGIEDCRKRELAVSVKAVGTREN